jgi:hypothetical protein
MDKKSKFNHFYQQKDHVLLLVEMAVFCLLLLLLPCSLFAQAELTDYGGADLVITEDTTLYGDHININRFNVATTATLSVALYDPEIPMTGRLIIRAQDINVEGVINAFGAGYTGGGGGSKEVDEDTGEVILGGSGRYPGFTAQSSTGQDGDGDARGYHESNDLIGNGGYCEKGINGDVSFDESLLMGSGGAGGYAWNSYLYAKGGGGGGGSGGGFVKLYAQNHLVMTGKVTTRGSLGENGEDGKYIIEADHFIAVNGRGGNAWPYEEGVGGITVNSNSEALSEGYCGTRGGSGAGGGILLRCDTPNALSITGVIDARGGRDDYTENGGTVKVFSPTPVEVNEGNILSGRTVLFQTTAIIDHEGQDLIITEDTTLFGEHININRFHVATSATLKIELYHPAIEMSGRLIIRAKEVDVEGTIDAFGAGYTGGGGGYGKGDFWQPQPFTVGKGRYPGFDGVRTDGWWGDGPDNPTKSWWHKELTWKNSEGSDDNLYMGSGGWGGDGAWLNGEGSGGGGGGAGGGCGGGYVRLYASDELELSGKIMTKGALGQNGSDGGPGAYCGLIYPPIGPPYYGGIPGTPGNGADAWPPGEGLGGKGGPKGAGCAVGRSGRSGGSGEGGGILLKCDKPDGLLITGEINALGGRDEISKGGTLKIFSPTTVVLNRRDIRVGRLYINAPVETVGWELY